MTKFCCAMLLTFVASALAVLPPLIPREVLFGNPDRSLPKLAPDATKLAWLAPDKEGVLNVWISSDGIRDARSVTNETHRPIRWYDWGDSNHILYLQDNDGDEIDHLFSVDLTSGNIRDLTPFRGVRAQNILTDPQQPRSVLVALNLRDRHAFDMYRVNLETGAVTMEAQNPGDVLTWSIDNDFVIRAATAFDGKTGETLIRVRAGVDKPWRNLIAMPFERALFAGQVVGGSLIAGFDPDGKHLLIHSAMGSDKGRIVRIDCTTGEERGVVAEDARSDVANFGGDDVPGVVLNPKTHALEAVKFDDGNPHWLFLDPLLKDDFERVGREVSGFPALLSRARDDTKWVLGIENSAAPFSYYLYERKLRKITPLFSESDALQDATLAPKKTMTIRARDGLSLVSYLSLPQGVEAKNLPLVLLVHGGPWFRDTATFEPEVQLLVNRGYAVLQVNYRGSTGFGLKFLNAGTRQWGLGTQEDLYDAVQWTVDQGIADPKRVASMGWSGGGFATLRALEMRPDLFRCGVDGVGPGEVATLLRSFPNYWANIMTRWRRRAGDADHDPAWNEKISPLYHVNDIRAPLLIGQGQNDPRVTIKNTDAMVAALRKAQRDVVYVVYPDEGHGFARPENNLDFYGRVEEFLAKHLGGRAQPWQTIPGSTADMR